MRFLGTPKTILSKCYNLRSGHFATFTNVTGPDGSPLLFAKASASVSPSHGDSIISAMIISEDIDLANSIGHRTQTGLETLIRGTDQYFAIVVGDFGYEFVPHNANLAGRVLLKQFCKDVGAVFLAPPSADADVIYQINDNGFIDEMPTDNLEGLRSRRANSKGLVGQIRKPVEQIHGALFQCWCI